MIKFHQKLDDIQDQDEQQRVLDFIATFRENLGSNPDYVIRSPGRINLIGDHIDYHGFSVLPMAIKNSILLGISTKTMANNETSSSGGDVISGCHGAISIRNKDSITYPNFASSKHTFAHGSQLDKSHQWHHYVLCGYHGVLANRILNIEPSGVFAHARDIGGSAEDEKLQEELKESIDMFVDSNLPPASGLSSSSALVCASALATELFLAKNNGRPEIDSKKLAENCSKFEHLVGTHGGGMDQAVIMTAQEGYAKHVEFIPQFSCENVRLPDNVVWLVSHCGVNYPKAATSGFNCRVLETKLAAALIVKALKPTSSIALDHTISLGRVKEELFAPQSTASDIISTLRDRVFHDGAQELGIDGICLRLEMSRQELVAGFKTSEEFLVRNNLERRVCLLKRVEHVFEEAERVARFKLICDTTTQADIKKLGQLMSWSHVSLRDKYECSHAALDRLVEISLEAGALGARLTGAGWGGCIVSMVEASKCRVIMGELKKVSKFTFQTEPRGGCTIIGLNDAR